MKTIKKSSSHASTKSRRKQAYKHLKVIDTHIQRK